MYMYVYVNVWSGCLCKHDNVVYVNMIMHMSFIRQDYLETQSFTFSILKQRLSKSMKVVLLRYHMKKKNILMCDFMKFKEVKCQRVLQLKGRQSC